MYTYYFMYIHIYIYIVYLTMFQWLQLQHPTVPAVPAAPSPRRPPGHAPGTEGSAAAPRLPPCPHGTPAVQTENLWNKCQESS